MVNATDGEEGLAAAQGGEFDLIMLDWNMPKMDGLDVLKALRSAGNTTPVMMVTGSKEREQVMEAFSAGANDYIGLSGFAAVLRLAV